jgi:hypothetical protein
MDGAEVTQLVSNPLRRSRFPYYEAFAESLTSQLVRLLAIPEDDDPGPEIGRALRDLAADMMFVRRQHEAARCEH